MLLLYNVVVILLKALLRERIRIADWANDIDDDNDDVNDDDNDDEHDDDDNDERHNTRVHINTHIYFIVSFTVHLPQQLFGSLSSGSSWPCCLRLVSLHAPPGWWCHDQTDQSCGSSRPPVRRQSWTSD